MGTWLVTGANRGIGLEFPGAPLTPAVSIETMLRVIDRLRPSDSGRFLDRRGRDVPW
jgi:hypothetical protein